MGNTDDEFEKFLKESMTASDGVSQGVLQNVQIWTFMIFFLIFENFPLNFSDNLIEVLPLVVRQIRAPRG